MEQTGRKQWAQEENASTIQITQQEGAVASSLALVMLKYSCSVCICCSVSVLCKYFLRCLLGATKYARHFPIASSLALKGVPMIFADKEIEAWKIG